MELLKDSRPGTAICDLRLVERGLLTRPILPRESACYESWLWICLPSGLFLASFQDILSKHLHSKPDSRQILIEATTLACLVWINCVLKKSSWEHIQSAKSLLSLLTSAPQSTESRWVHPNSRGRNTPFKTRGMAEMVFTGSLFLKGQVEDVHLFYQSRTFGPRSILGFPADSF